MGGSVLPPLRIEDGAQFMVSFALKILVMFSSTRQYFCLLHSCNILKVYEQ